MHPTLLLRAEGLAAFAVATVAYVSVDAPLWLFVVLALAPDVLMIGYLSGPRFGALCYNAAHTYVGPLALIAVGTVTALPLVTPVGLVWAAHVGADRALGYGLKHRSGFGDTHLGPVGAARKRAAGSDPDGAE